MPVRRANDATNHVTVAEKHLQTMQRVHRRGDTSQRRRRRHRAKIAALLIFFFASRIPRAPPRVSANAVVLSFRFSPPPSFIRVYARPSIHTKEGGVVMMMMLLELLEDNGPSFQRPLSFSSGHLGFHSLFESLNVKVLPLFFGKPTAKKRRFPPGTN